LDSSRSLFRLGRPLPSTSPFMRESAVSSRTMLISQRLSKSMKSSKHLTLPNCSSQIWRVCIRPRQNSRPWWEVKRLRLTTSTKHQQMSWLYRFSCSRKPPLSHLITSLDAQKSGKVSLALWVMIRSSKSLPSQFWNFWNQFNNALTLSSWSRLLLFLTSWANTCNMWLRMSNYSAFWTHQFLEFLRVKLLAKALDRSSR
jgi:hypothetical protein